MSEISENEHICSNPDCKVSETGKCIEGFELEKCSYYGQRSSVDDDLFDLDPMDENEPDKDSLDEAEGAFLALHDGKCIPVNDVGSVLKKFKARVISFIGHAGSGKTTLIASLYEQFQNDPNGFAGFKFAHSHSLHAFEKACHYARIPSRRLEPHTERTSLGFDVQFYHLGLREDKKDNVVSLLLADRAGETYFSISDSTENADECVEIYRSDCINILVDGKKLCDLGERHSIKMNLNLILQGLTEQKVLNKKQNIAVVLTKYDEIASLVKEEQDDVMAFFDELVEDFNCQYKECVNSINPFLIAASPKKNSVDRGFGLEELFLFMHKSKSYLAIKQDQKVESKRAIDWIK